MSMSAREYRKAIKQLGLSQAKAAKFLGFSARQSRRLAGGKATLSLATTMLIRVMLHCGLTVQAVNDIVAPPKASRSRKKADEAVEA